MSRLHPFLSERKTWTVLMALTFEMWVEMKGGAEGIKGNKEAVWEIIEGYVEKIDLGFEVSKSNVFLVLEYYVGKGGEI